MSYAARELRKGLRRVLWAQISLTFVVAAVAALDAPHHDALARLGAALAGGAVAMLGALLLAYSLARADVTHGSAAAQLWLYGGAVARFVCSLEFVEPLRIVVTVKTQADSIITFHWHVSCQR